MMPYTFSTTRLLLRPWKPMKIPEICAYANDELWSPYNPVPFPYSEKDVETFIAQQILHDPKKGTPWAITLGGAVIGGCEIRWFAERKIGEIGYAIARANWGKGFATEAVAAMVGHAFQLVSDLVRIRASFHHKNVASGRVLAKCGFQQEGTLRLNSYNRGALGDQIWCGLLREEWSGVGAGRSS